MSLFPQKLLEKHRIVDWAYTEEEAPRSFDQFEKWIGEEKHGALHYLADHRKEKRRSIKEYFPQFQSSLVFLFSYNPTSRELQKFYQSQDSNGLKISSYVFGFEGEDYHLHIRESLKELEQCLKDQFPEIESSYSLDIHPVLERDLAFRSGLGWFGKNSMFIHPKEGSFFLIASLFLNKKLALELRPVQTDHCGQCTACIDACPTDAINGSKRQIEADKCISTFTIELFKDAEAPKGYENSGGEIFGCDICQDVCPWNKRISRLADSSPSFDPPEGSDSEKILSFFLKRPIDDIISELNGWSNKQYQRFFKGTSLFRTGRVGMLKNLKAQLKRDS